MEKMTGEQIGEREAFAALGIKVPDDPSAEGRMIEALKAMQRGEYDIRSLPIGTPEIVPAFLQISVGSNLHRIKIESITAISWIHDSSTFHIHTQGIPDIRVRNDQPDFAVVKELFDSLVIINPTDKEARVQ